MDLIDAVSTLMLARFQAKLHNQDIPITPSVIIPTQLLADCERATTILVQAFRNRGANPHLHTSVDRGLTQNVVYTSWDVRRYSDSLSPMADGRNEKLERTLSERFKPIYDIVTLIRDAATMVDKFGCIMTWYLPLILTFDRQVSVRHPLFDRLSLSYSADRKFCGKVSTWSRNCFRREWCRIPSAGEAIHSISNHWALATRNPVFATFPRPGSNRVIR